MEKIILLLLMAGFISPGVLGSRAGTRMPAKKRSAVVAQIEQTLKKWESKTLPGFSIAVVKEGEVIFKRGYGMADTQNGISNTPETVYNIGSVTKQFTAMSILLLEEQGKLSLQDPASNYLPGFPEYGNSITLYHLMHQTSGLSDYLNLAILSGAEPFKNGLTKEQVWRLLQSQEELIFEPGERFQYCNSNYFLLARIVENVSGLSYNEFAREHIFLPLGMKNTYLKSQLDKIEDFDKVANPYTTDSTGVFVKDQISAGSSDGAGGIFSTVEDLVLWERNFHNNKLGNKSQELIEKLQARGKLNDGTEISYAGGLFSGSFRGIKSFTH